MDFRAFRDLVHGTLLRPSPLVLYGATFCLIFTLTSTWYFLCTLALSTAISSCTQQVAQLKKKKLTAEKKIKNYDGLAQRVAELEAVLSAQKKIIAQNFHPEKEAVAKLLAEHQIAIHGCTPEKREVYSTCRVVPFCYFLSGSYESFAHFFAALRERKPAPVCTNLAIKRALDGVTCSLTISFLMRS